MNEPVSFTRVLLCCSGTGRINRGIESFFREAFDNLKNTPGLRLRLVKGAGFETCDERVSWSLPRSGALARALGATVGRNGYVVEQWSSFPSVVAQIRDFRPHVVFYSDANLGFLLFRMRQWIGVPFRLLFSNGGPVHPPFVRTDFVHQVTPGSHREALNAGESPQSHFLVPYGIRLVEAPALRCVRDRNALRQRLGLPVGRRVVLSVGWIRSNHKRMDYVIEEIARLPHPRPYLQLLGHIDPGSREIVAMGKRLLGQDAFGAFSVPYDQVFDYYRAADCFVLASLAEGFGRVYLEALMHGLPVIAHDCPGTRYVLGRCGSLGDLSRSGVLAGLIIEELSRQPDLGPMQKRWAQVRDRFSWPMLAWDYRDMFQICARGTSGSTTVDPIRPRATAELSAEANADRKVRVA
jgi:glycosyltransferase involved in cell wall biosynthesis